MSATDQPHPPSCRASGHDHRDPRGLYTLTTMSHRLLLGFVAFGMLLGPIAAAANLPFQSSDGRRSVSAVEARTPVTLDGALDEEVWRTAAPPLTSCRPSRTRGSPRRS